MRSDSNSRELNEIDPIIANDDSMATIPITTIARRSDASRGTAPERTTGVQDGFSKSNRSPIPVLPSNGETFPVFPRRMFL